MKQKKRKNQQQNNLLITGATLRKQGYELGEGKYYDKAVLLSLNLDTGYFKELLSISTGNQNTPDSNPNLEFTIGDIEPNNLWLTTDTEIRLYSYPELNVLKVFSHPCFHNIHSLAVRGEQLYITSTGLDMVVILDKNTGEIIDRINTEYKPVWHRFSADIDYRKLHSTRPHDSHPNYIFWLDNQPWVTRCTPEDAVCLYDKRKRIDLTGLSENPSQQELSVHDGIVKQGKIYFTSVDGCILIVDSGSLKLIETIELYKFKNYGGVRGWCRGLYIEGDLFYIGFSRLRKTKAKGKLAWLSRFSNYLSPSKQSSVLAFDMKKRIIVKDYPIPEDAIDAVYAILPEPDNQ